ncbi:hypothetical protein [Robertkochia sediminum]|uniref:hypothetical protein n=1 Tax=Robertkochia sediminum TaxID=2785326 RepID=UPI001931ED05|nr:hypothetical protein [Robertkochia sediminum]MBL7471422.1 hypothetical protein [Robertkochia sediminum]
MSDKNHIAALHQNFIELLERIYGCFDREKNKFESTSNSKIARDLFYSDSQFSRLINGTASEGEFGRAVRNVQRSLELMKAKEHSNEVVVEVKKNPLNKLLLALVAALVLGGLYLVYKYTPVMPAENDVVSTSDSRYDMLKWSFENHYINPYVKLKELPDDCYYPCYKYQGKWTLKQEYKIPFFRERNGFHYVAKEATMYTNCLQTGDTQNGEAFEGYEYQKHEIWYDVRELPIDSFLVEAGSTKVRPEYNNSRMEDDQNFVKIAYIHTFFRSEYQIDSLGIHRQGKVIGRDIEFVEQTALLDGLGDAKLVSDVKSEMNAIAQNRLEDFSKPISCDPGKLPRADFHAIDEGDELEFNCQFSTGRFLVDYKKTYVLDYQYINNVCR